MVVLGNLDHGGGFTSNLSTLVWKGHTYEEEKLSDNVLL